MIFLPVLATSAIALSSITQVPLPLVQTSMIPVSDPSSNVNVSVPDVALSFDDSPSASASAPPKPKPKPTPKPEVETTAAESSLTSATSRGNERTDSTPASTSATTTNSAPAPVGDVQAIAAEMLAARGWGNSAQWSAFANLVNRESGWNIHAVNSSSGACGIPQALPCSKLSTAGADYWDNPATQITWMLNYIAGRYGDPIGAWAHSQATGWY